MRQLVRMFSLATGSWEVLPARRGAPRGLVTWRQFLPVQWRLAVRLRRIFHVLRTLPQTLVARVRRDGGVSSEQGILLFGLLVVLVAVL